MTSSTSLSSAHSLPGIGPAWIGQGQRPLFSSINKAYCPVVKFLVYIEVSFVVIVTLVFYLNFFDIEFFGDKELVQSSTKFEVFSVMLSVWDIGDSLPFVMLFPIDVK